MEELNSNSSINNEGMSQDIILSCSGIVKKFPGNVALDHVDLNFRRGEVHALVGQNGAGKSTVVKVITGVYTSDEGEIKIDGKSIKITNPKDAEQAGLAIIHQDQQMVPQFDVKRNVFLGREIKQGLLLNFKEMQRQTEEALRMIDADFSANDLVCNLSVGQREQVAIAAALLRQPKILILDEPTASLSRKEVKKLFEIIRHLKEAGVTIIYISHHFDEIFEISDRITVLRDGKTITTMDVASCNKSEVINIMIGRDVSQLYPRKDLKKGDTLLEVKNIHYKERLNGMDFVLHRGEILGIAGILGSGIAELATSLFGVDKITEGELLINSLPMRIKSPRIAKNCGLALIPEDRRNEGLIPNMTIEENLSLAFPKNLANFGVLSKRLGRDASEKVSSVLSVKSTGIDQLVNTLSGGNQQKIAIGRWLMGNSEIFILNQPTTGVDVGSKIEIYKAIVGLAEKGAGVIMISQDFEELLGMCDRIAVVADGRITKTFQYGEATEAELLEYATTISEQAM